MNETHFQNLLNRLMDEDLTEEEINELSRMVREKPEREAELSAQLVGAEMIAQAKDELKSGRRFIAATLERLGDDAFVTKVRAAIGGEERVAFRKSPRSPVSRSWSRAWLLALAVACLLGLVAIPWVFRSQNDPNIITITALQGATQWTGDGGRLKVDLEIGRSLGGGTLESLSEESWIVLEFRDGSAVTVIGRSMVTVSSSENDGIELYLRRGSLSADVVRRPVGKPMQIHTPTALLEILGTQLNLDADASSTALYVNEGRVRITRLVDGGVAVVPADHQIVASLDPQGLFEVKRRPEPVNSWRSRLPADAKYGIMSDTDASVSHSLRASPYLLICGQPKPLLLFLTAFSVDSKNSPPVLPLPDGRFQIQGRMESSGELIFGLTMKYPKGGFAGKYIASRRFIIDENTEKTFTMEFNMSEFQPQEAQFPAVPTNLELLDCWCLTIRNDLGLRIQRVELIPARAETPQKTEP